MTLGELFEIVAQKDMAGSGKQGLIYEEYVKDGKFVINLRCTTDDHAYILTSAPNIDDEEKRNQLRSHFLSSVFNAAIIGQKRLNTLEGRDKKNKHNIRPNRRN